MEASEKSDSVVRVERDSLGELAVPAEAYYGVQAKRAQDNFLISGISINTFPTLIKTLAMIKKSAAAANFKAGGLADWKRDAIMAACDDVIRGDLDEWFIVDAFQGGAGTSSNMNMNEVVANRALEHLGYPKGDYMTLHPNDDVNMSQSTNDVFPTAVRLAILLAVEDLDAMLGKLIENFEDRAHVFRDTVKLGRTQLQDALPMTLGQEFRAFAVTLREDGDRIAYTSKLLEEVNLGGTAIGTGLNAPENYSELILAELEQVFGRRLSKSHDLIEASWDVGAFVSFSGALKRLAVKLSKIADDLRLLSSGPRGGFGEITLPSMQPGSSIMPGKVNPVIPESLNQVCFQVIGNDLTVTMAAASGQLQLNAFEPLIAYNILNSLNLLTNAMRNFASRCVCGIEANVEVCLQHVSNSSGLATALVPSIGYEKAAEIARTAMVTGRPVADTAIQFGIDAELLDTIIDPLAMSGMLHDD